MKPFLIAIRTTFVRFRLEILGFWLLSCGLTTAYALQAGPFGTPDSAQPRPLPQIGLIEICAGCWIILRLMLSETIFLTQGSWKTRPFPRPAVPAAPFVVLGIAIAPTLVARGIAAWVTTAPAPGQWLHVVISQILPVLGTAGLIAAALCLAGGMIRGRTTVLRRNIAMGIAGSAAVAAWLHPITRQALMASTPGDYGRTTGGTEVRGDFVAGIKELAGGDATFIGDWTPWSPPAPRLKVALRIPLAGGAEAGKPGASARIVKLETRERRLVLELELRVFEAAMSKELSRATMVVRYSGNTYAGRVASADERSPGGGVLLPPFRTIHRYAAFAAPAPATADEVTPEWSRLLADAELLLFVPDNSLPPIKILPPENNPGRPPAPQSKLAGEVAAIFDRLDFPAERTVSQELVAEIAKLPAEALPSILARHPWSDLAWDHLVDPFLLKHAADADKPGLQARLATEPRLGEVFVRKGWLLDALPQLRRFASDRLPLDKITLAALLELKEPDLAEDLAALSIRLDTGIEELEPLLRAHPALDWQRLVRDGWLRRKYSFRREGPVAPFDLWAAREGDASALRYIAEGAARGFREQTSRLPSLVEGSHADVVAYLRENIDRLTFDESTRKWR